MGITFFVCAFFSVDVIAVLLEDGCFVLRFLFFAGNEATAGSHEQSLGKHAAPTRTSAANLALKNVLRPFATDRSAAARVPWHV